MKTLGVLLTLTLTLNGAEFTNSLVYEESPYLLQHKNNPVDWYPWEEQAFSKAEKENKLIFLSVGYSTCHWCHVMEEESFENKEIAKLLNRYFISVKVDKEEFPNIDTHYQYNLSKLQKRRNGWPLTAILTPKKEIVYITTYIPPTKNYGIKGMDELVPYYGEMSLEKIQKLVAINKRKENIKIEKKEYSDLEKSFIDAMWRRYDKLYYGFDSRPKFPLANHLKVLFEIYQLTGNKKAKKMVLESANAMIEGGLYDQIEGAFYRYSVHPDWIIPHFEKMLYTTAELIPVYVDLYKETKNERFKEIILESLDFVDNYFKKEDLFFSASDADSFNNEGEKEEGTYYTYNQEEVEEALFKEKFTEEEIEQILTHFGISLMGNFEHGKSNPELTNLEEINPTLKEKAKAILKLVRSKRELPFIDNKIIVSWNAMMITALFKAGEIDKRKEKEAFRSLDKLVREYYKKGKLYHKSLYPQTPSQEALLEDYAYLSETLLIAYQRSFKKRYLDLAKELLLKSKQKFYRDGKWYLDNDGFNAEAQYEDRYYTAPLPKLFNAFLTLANLEYNLSLLFETKKLIENERYKIQENISKHPEGIRALIRVTRKDVILKANRENLIKNMDKILQVNYPFLNIQIENNTKEFLACDESVCFAHNKDLDLIIDEINKYSKGQ